MERPAAEVLDELEAALTDLTEAETAVKELKARVTEITMSLRDRVTDETLFLAVTRWLYWMVPRVNAKTLAVAIYGLPYVERLRKLVGPVVAGISCASCGAEVRFESRAALHAVIQANEGKARRASPYAFLCQQCTAAMHDRAREPRDAELRARQKRLRELKTMPYSEYLMTPEWDERRRRHLRSAGYRCQVCNATNTRLNVHHRTYATIGEERYVDLLVLCEDCHRIFHKEGKLVRE